MSGFYSNRLGIERSELGDRLPWFTDILCILLSAVYLNQLFRLTPNLPQMIYYGVVIALNCLILATVTLKGFAPWMPMWIFWLLMWFSILVNWGEDIAVFKAPYRTISFLAVQLVVAPFFRSRQLTIIRERVFDILNTLILFMAMLSFMGRVFQFFPSDNNGYYLGCTWHSMDLAAIMGIASIYAMHCVTAARNNLKIRNIYIACFVASFLVLLLSSSRTTLISCTIALLAYWGCGASQSMSRIIKPTILICLMIYGLSLAFPDAFQGVLRKSMSSTNEVTMESFTNSRAAIWNSRIQEIKEYPFFGTGAHTVRYDKFGGSGQIEPGNAWLYIFSSMGVFQFMLFCSMMGKAVIHCRTFAKPGRKSSFILALLVYFGLYMVGEAHITAAGEFTCVYFWLLLSVAVMLEMRKDAMNGNRPVELPGNSGLLGR